MFLLSLNSCTYSETKACHVSPVKYTNGQVAITDGQDIYMTDKDSLLDSTKFIYLNKPGFSISDTLPMKKGYFTVYQIDKTYGRYNTDVKYHVLISNGEKNLELKIYDNVPEVGDRVLVFYKDNVSFNTIKVK
jgi:hypothetical protein